MKKFWPYFAYLKGARLTFAGGLLAGAIYAFSTGFGMPFMINTVFPVIFPEEETVAVATAEAPAVQPAPPAAAGKPDGLEKRFAWITEPEILRTKGLERWGPERGPKLLLLYACVALVVAAAVRGLSSALNIYWVTAAGLHVLLQIQQRVFEKLQRLPLGFFSGRKTGDLISRVITDSNMLQAMVTTISNDLVKQPLTLISAIGYLIYYSFTNSEGAFLIIFLITVPVMVMPIRLIGKRLMRRAAHMQAEGGDNTAILGETLGATREIRAFNLEDMMANRFFKGVKRWMRLHLKVIKYRVATPPMIELSTRSTPPHLT